jgi:Spy/CpxP family protein refolding chaperone
MKTHKKIGLLMISLVLILPQGFTQQGMQSAEWPTKGQGRLACLTDLTTEQQTQLKTLRDLFWTEMKSVRENKSLTPDEKQSLFIEKRTDHQDQIKAILTPEQQEEMDHHLKNGPGLDGKGGKGFCPEPFAFQDDDMQGHLMEKRVAFDSELSDTEKATIDVMRDLLVKHREQIQELKSGTKTRQEKRVMHFEHIDQMEPLFEIADAHEESLQAIFEEIRTTMRPDCPNKNQGFGLAHKGRRAGWGAPTDKHIIHFLLLDPEEPTGAEIETGSSSLMVYPNPVEENMVIKFYLPASGMVNIELWNKQGEMLDVLDSLIREAGDQSFNFNASGLPAREVYFVKVRFANKTLVKKFIKI